LRVSLGNNSKLESNPSWREEGGFLHNSGWSETKTKMDIKNDMIIIDIRAGYT
jgi:hypothetical protein